MAAPSLPVPLHVHAKQHAVLLSPQTCPNLPKAFPIANPTISFWQQDLNIKPSPTEGSEDPLPGDVDICVIGSGITGVSAAYHLAKRFAKEEPNKPITAAIFEAREFCSGATGRNGGHLTAATHEDFVYREKLYGKEDAVRETALQQYTVAELVKVIREHGREVDVDLVSGGCMQLFFSEQELADARADFAAAQDAGIDVSQVEWMGKEEVLQQYGAPYPGVRRPGNNVWPLKTVGLLYELAKTQTSKFSVDLYTRTPVTSISPYSDSASPRRWSVETPRGMISCSYILHATNAYVSHLLPHMSGPDGVIPTRGQVMAVRATAPPDAITSSAWGANEGFEYWFPRPVKPGEAAPLVIIGGGREAAKPTYELYEVDDSVCNEEVGRVMRRFLPSVFPGKYDENGEPEVEWSGIMGFTKTGDPFVGPVVSASGDPKPFEGQYLSAGFSGHGMPRTFACAEAVAEMIACDVLGRTWAVPDWLPRHYLTFKP
ncbi:hypothetical protein PHLGIDRAFT_131084 [Phlebiopsis gigantea 11061_1 CR5-6]|uniref:FAD dependent oxidoreductase domain-containing protein n=1 Tax=Phlebiopsis gigantea (strain 11061_1 CR5-6) TaxID=745531 RepID=A0A0C3RZG5_PHLG1|nr:hypothetical protein PHLGIDRAFT_131084 [Phlebiopsis gigantea 11061_1 CR5-6]